MTFNGVPIDGNLHVWNMCDKDGVGKPAMFDRFMRAFPNANILQITQYAIGRYLYTSVWFVDEYKEVAK